MRFGFILPNLLSPVSSASAITTSARLAEMVGFDSIWATDHILMPDTHPRYAKGTEAITTLAYVAGITQRVTLGLSVLVLPMRNPIIVAKQIASVVHLSGRELIFGAGVGWNETEYGYLNADFRRRGKLMDEYLDILRTLWTADKPEHAGTYNFSGAAFSPRPSSSPPIWVGGESEAALKRAAKLGDGYHPNFHTDAEYVENVRRIREMSEGRPITMSFRATFDMDKGAQLVVDQLGRLRDQAGLEYPVVGFKHETLGELVSQIEGFGRDVIPALRA